MTHHRRPTMTDSGTINFTPSLQVEGHAKQGTRGTDAAKESSGRRRGYGDGMQNPIRQKRRINPIRQVDDRHAYSKGKGKAP